MNAQQITVREFEAAKDFFTDEGKVIIEIGCEGFTQKQSLDIESANRLLAALQQKLGEIERYEQRKRVWAYKARCETKRTAREAATIA